MAHEVESMMYVGETPWHNLGRNMTGQPLTTAKDALVAAGLDWKVERREMFAQSKALLTATNKSEVKGAARAIRIPDAYAIVRDRDESVLGVVGPAYTPLQNEEAFSFLDPILKDGDATWETAGSLRGGSVVWGLLRMAKTFQVVPGDPVRSYMLVTSSHDGSRVVQVRFSPVRVVCMNTLSAATPRGESSRAAESDGAVKIRHTSSVKQRTEQAVELLTQLYKSATMTEEVCKKLADKAMKPQTVKEFVASLFVDEKNQLSARAENTVDTILDLVENGKGSNIKGVRGTAWGVYNGITAFTSHLQGLTAEQARTGRVPTEKAESRLDSVWFGTSKKLADRALVELLAV